MTGTLTLSNNEMIPLRYFEHYPTVGSLADKILLCKAEDLRMYLLTCDRAKAEDYKIYWLVDNRFHNSTIYKKATMMTIIENMDGIIIIDDDQYQYFNIFSRNFDNLVLRVEPAYFEKLEEYDMFEHFKIMKEKYENKKITIHTVKEYQDLYNVIYTIEKEELNRYGANLSYSGTAD